jgi:hypothetical protein
LLDVPFTFFTVMIFPLSLFPAASPCVCANLPARRQPGERLYLVMFFASITYKTACMKRQGILKAMMLR